MCFRFSLKNIVLLWSRPDFRHEDRSARRRFQEIRLCYWKNSVINDCPYFGQTIVTAGPKKAVG